VINEVNVRQVRLVLGWVTVSGFDSRGHHFISVCNQPPRSTQPFTLRGMVTAEGRYVMLWRWGVEAGMVYLQVKLRGVISKRFRKYTWYLKTLLKCPGLHFTLLLTLER